MFYIVLINDFYSNPFFMRFNGSFTEDISEAGRFSFDAACELLDRFREFYKFSDYISFEKWEVKNDNLCHT